MMSVRQKSNTVGKYEVKAEVSLFFFPLFLKNFEITPLVSYKLILEQQEEKLNSILERDNS